MRGVVLAEEVERAVHGDYLRGAHVVVGVPSLLRQVLAQQRGRGALSNARVVIVDEVDECFAVRSLVAMIDRLSDYCLVFDCCLTVDQLAWRTRPRPPAG